MENQEAQDNQQTEEVSPTQLDVFEPNNAREQTSISAIKSALHEEAREESERVLKEMEESPKEQGEIDVTDMALQKAMEVDDAETNRKASKKGEDSEDEADEDDEDSEDERRRAESEADEAESDSDEEEDDLEPGEQKFKEKEISFVVGDEEVKVKNNAIIEVPVNGKVKRLHLQEVINRASGDVYTEEKLKEVQSMRDKESHLWRQRQTQIDEANVKIKEHQNTIQRLTSLATESKPEDLLAYCARVAKKDPKQVLRKFVQDISGWAEKFNEMDDNQRDVWYKNLDVSVEKFNLEEDRKELQRKRDESAKRTEKEEMTKYALSKMQEASVTQEEFQAQVKDLTKRGIVLNGKSAQDKIDEVLDYVHESRVITAAKDLDPGLLRNRELLQKVFDVTLSMGIYTKDKLQKVLSEVSGKELKTEEKRIADNLSRKVRSNRTTSKREKDADAEDYGPFTLKGFRERHHGF